MLSSTWGSNFILQFDKDGVNLKEVTKATILKYLRFYINKIITHQSNLPIWSSYKPKTEQKSKTSTVWLNNIFEYILANHFKHLLEWLKC